VTIIRVTDLQLEDEQDTPAIQPLECFFYSEAEAAARLGIRRITLRTLALAGHASVEPIAMTAHRRVYRRVDIHRLAGIELRKTRVAQTYYLVRVKSGRLLVATKASDTKREAEAWERTQKHLLDTGRPLPPKRSFTLSAMGSMSLAAREAGNPHTVDTDRNNLAALPESPLRRPLASIHARDIREHLLAKLRASKKPSTVARSKTTLSALFTYAADQGLLHRPHPVKTDAHNP